jgi:hypothetical protein
MMLECPGVFLAPLVPDGWTATGDPGRSYELVPPGGGALAQISVYHRPKRPIPEHEARDMVASFMNKALGATGGEIRVVAKSRKERRAISRYTRPGSDGEPVEWFVVGIVWPATMLMCSCSARPGDPALTDAERMLASIVPLNPPWWQFWRR